MHNAHISIQVLRRLFARFSKWKGLIISSGSSLQREHVLNLPPYSKTWQLGGTVQAQFTVMYLHDNQIRFKGILHDEFSQPQVSICLIIHSQQFSFCNGHCRKTATTAMATVRSKWEELHTAGLSTNFKMAFHKALNKYVMTYACPA
jgi:hypothetical protein